MKKILISVTAVIVAVVMFFCVLSGVMILHSRKNIDYSLDEELFDKAKKDQTVYYYAINSSNEIVEVYKSSKASMREWTPFEDIGNNLINGFIAMEDRDFYKHKGVNIKRTIAAVINHVFKFKDSFGASTITQQLIKNISGDNEVNIERKTREIMRAINLEKKHSKNDIFELYLNVIPFSGNIFGVGAASEIYFGKSPHELSISEAATLVGITNAPSKYNPYTRENACIEKRNRVLFAMKESGMIDEAEYTQAIKEPLLLNSSSSNFGVSSWFIETAHDEILGDLCDQYGISRSVASLLLGGCRIILTMNTEIQRIMEDCFSNENNLSSKFYDGLCYSMVVTDPMTGDLLGIIGNGGKKSADLLFNYATSPITPGSVIKPLSLYAPLIDEGSISWSTIEDDSPIEYKEKDGELSPYPRNSPDIYSGPIDINEAIRKSKNTVAIRLYERMGAKKIFEHLKNAYSFDTLIEKSNDINGNTISDLGAAPLALGQLSYGVTLRRITEAYNVFPAEGILCKGRSYSTVYDRSGNVLIKKEIERNRVYSKETAQVMNQLLSNVVFDGTAKQIMLKEVIDVAGKTGTSGNDRDRLFVGYTPFLTAGIWCGYGKENKPVGSNSPNHLEIWDNVMSKIHDTLYLSKFDESIPGFSIGNLIIAPYCSHSGDTPTERCELDEDSEIRLGYFKPDNFPNNDCEYH